jgi:hypothetical protein
LVYGNALYCGRFLSVREPLRGHLIVGHQRDGEQSDYYCQDAKHNEHDTPSCDRFPSEVLEALLNNVANKILSIRTKNILGYPRSETAKDLTET